MGRTKASARSLALWVCLGAFAPAQQGPPAPATSAALVGEADYRAGLEAARKLSREQEWKSANSAWLELLRAHPGANYLRPELEEIRLQLRRTAFWSKTKAPKLDDLLSGDLRSWEPSRAWLSIRYTREQLADFSSSVVDGQPLYSHPAHFQDAWSISLEGTPDEVASTVFLISDGSSGHGVKFGQNESGKPLYFPHTLFAFAESGSRELQTVEPKQLKPKTKSVSAQIRVDARLLRGFYAGTPVLQTERSSRDFGGLSFTGKGAFGTLALEGKIDSGWIDGVLDRAMAQKRLEFDAAWEEPPELAAWNSAAPAAGQEPSIDEIVQGLEFKFAGDEQTKALYSVLDKALLQGRKGCLEVLDALALIPPELKHDAMLDYVKLRASVGLGRYNDALVHLAAVKIEPEHERARALLRASFLELAGSRESAAAEFEALASANPTLASVHTKWIESLLRLGKREPAREVMQRARAAMPASLSLAALELQVTKATLGPPWKRVFEHKGAHFIVRSDVSAKLCRDAVRVLDKAMERCVFEFGALPEGPREPSVAYLFGGEAGYKDYVKGIADGSAENSLGVYALLLKQVVAWNQPDEERLWSVLRHECLHRYLDLRLGEPPRWFNEGLAETFAAGGLRDGTWASGTLCPERLAMLRAKLSAVGPLADFAYLSDAQFMEHCEENYALAWAWVHFLRFESEAGRKLIATLLDGLDAGLDDSTALDRALADVDGPALLTSFLAFVNALPR